jgi:hypothetical protein
VRLHTVAHGTCWPVTRGAHYCPPLFHFRASLQHTRSLVATCTHLHRRSPYPQVLLGRWQWVAAGVLRRRYRGTGA